MARYILYRLALMIPTLFGILLLNFIVVQAAPGGPVEQLLFKLTSPDAFSGTSGRVSGPSSDFAGKQQSGGQQANVDLHTRGNRGLDPELIADIERMYGFDKPPHERFWQMLVNYVHFDFGDSFFRDEPVLDLRNHALI